VCPDEGCHKSFLRDTHLRHHVKTAHTDVRDYTCHYEDCGKTLSTGTRLRRHEAIHEAKQQFKCQICGQQFRKHVTLQSHIATKHEGKKPYICDTILESGTICGAGFNKGTRLKLHRGQVHGNLRYHCNICTATNDEDTTGVLVESAVELGFATYSAFQEHNKVIHPPRCPSCSLACTTAKELTRHIELAHGNQDQEAKQIHQCPEEGCERSFGKRGNLVVHIRTVHAQQRLFSCGGTEVTSLNNVEGWNGNDACGRDFKAKSQLEEHIRTAHLAMENRFKAKRQEKRKVKEANHVSAHKSSSTIGMLTGTAYGDDPRRSILCTVSGCNYRFMRGHDLQTHLHKHHGMLGEGVSHDAMMMDGNGEEPDLWLQLEVSAADGGTFWVGNQASDFDNDEDDDEEEDWQADMYDVVGDGHGWEDDLLVDPSLQN